MTAVNLMLALPSVEQAKMLAAPLMAEGLNVDIKPGIWTGTARPVAMSIQGESETDVQLILMPLRSETDYEVIEVTIA